MIAIEMRIRPSVWDSSGDGFSVQFTYSAFRSEKSQRLVAQSSRWKSVKVKVNLLFAVGFVAIITASHDRLPGEWRHLVRLRQR